MKISIVSMLLMLLLSTPAMAEKPSWAGKGKPSAEQKEAHKSAMDEKEKMEDEHDDEDEKDEKSKKSRADEDSDDDAEDADKEGKAKNKDKKGLEKQKASKAEQERKELDKGSDKGKEARETHSKKWWKLW